MRQISHCSKANRGKEGRVSPIFYIYGERTKDMSIKYMRLLLTSHIVASCSLSSGSVSIKRAYATHDTMTNSQRNPPSPARENHIYCIYVIRVRSQKKNPIQSCRYTVSSALFLPFSLSTIYY